MKVLFFLVVPFVCANASRLRAGRAAAEATGALVAGAHVGAQSCDCTGVKGVKKMLNCKKAATSMQKRAKLRKKVTQKMIDRCTNSDGTLTGEPDGAATAAVVFPPISKPNPVETCCVATSNTKSLLTTYKAWQNQKTKFTWDTMVGKVAGALKNDAGECDAWFAESIAAKLDCGDHKCDPCKVNLFGIADGNGVENYQQAGRLARVITHEPLNNVIEGGRTGAFTFYPYLEDMEATIFMASYFKRGPKGNKNIDYSNLDEDIANTIQYCEGFTYTCNEIYTAICNPSERDVYWVRGRLSPWKKGASYKQGLDFTKKVKYNGVDSTVEELFAASKIPADVLAGDTITNACTEWKAKWCISTTYRGTVGEGGKRTGEGYGSLKRYYKAALVGSAEDGLLRNDDGPFNLGVLFDDSKSNAAKEDKLRCSWEDDIPVEEGEEDEDEEEEAVQSQSL